MSKKPDKPPRTPVRRMVTILVAVFAVVALAAAAMGIWAYRSLNANISTIDPEANNALGTARPAKENQAMNILAIGSDSRSGDNSFVGGESPGLADTTMVVHLAADNSWATAVSIPRDSMVAMPDCVAPDGSTTSGGFRQFNSAYAIGGPLCVQRTVESLTGLAIDHFVEVDFAGFSDMVDAVGGVPVYVAAPISDPNSKIFFDKGCQVLTGKQALKYVRVRHGVDDGSDTARIKRQQQFLSSLIQEVTSSGVLFNPLDLYRFLDAATGAVTTDTGLGGVSAMAPLALRVREIGLESIAFTTVPTAAWSSDPNRLVWAEPDATKMWDKLRTDKPVVKPSKSPSASAGSATGSASESASPKPTPEQTSTLEATTADQPICPK